MIRHRLLLADDEPAILELLQTILAEEYEIVGAVQNGRQLIEAAGRLQPDLIITDVSMGDTNGFAAAREIRERQPASRIVILSGAADSAYLREMVRSSLNGYVLKPYAAEQLPEAVRTALNGGAYISPEIRRP